jgi:hypothetical protein
LCLRLLPSHHWLVGDGRREGLVRNAFDWSIVLNWNFEGSTVGTTGSGLYCTKLEVLRRIISTRSTCSVDIIGAKQIVFEILNLGTVLYNLRTAPPCLHRQIC